jgi:hypothetical protein
MFVFKGNKLVMELCRDFSVDYLVVVKEAVCFYSQ